jgi:hypothetical protein
MPEAPRWSAVVMPCLNEEDYLTAACASLGFGGSVNPTPPQCRLILVDNGSTDRTLDICHALQDELGELVVIVQEPVRGHVPARHRGNMIAAQIAAAEGISPDQAVIIQADADTEYSAGYVDNVRAAYVDAPVDGQFVQAITVLPPDLRATYPRVFAAMDAVDQSMETRFGLQQYDFVVDDKACAYGLDDYFKCGAHRREFFRDGTEILAETTRLMIASQALGLKNIEIADATAIHSQRRFLHDAAQHLATAGFPYSARRASPGARPITLEKLESLVTGESDVLESITAIRAVHLVALMVLLPAQVVRACTGELPTEPYVRRILRDMPARSLEDVATTPGQLLADVLDLVWGADSPSLACW